MSSFEEAKNYTLSLLKNIPPERIRNIKTVTDFFDFVCDVTEEVNQRAFDLTGEQKHQLVLNIFNDALQHLNKIGLVSQDLINLITIMSREQMDVYINSVVETWNKHEETIKASCILFQCFVKKCVKKERKQKYPDIEPNIVEVDLSTLTQTKSTAV